MMLSPSPFTTDFNDDEALKKYIKDEATSEMHLMGTMKMGRQSDQMAVVDSSLRLRGSKKIRVADTSIFPTGVRGHPMATAMTVGEKCADLIIKEHGGGGAAGEETNGDHKQCTYHPHAAAHPQHQAKSDGATTTGEGAKDCEKPEPPEGFCWTQNCDPETSPAWGLGLGPAW